MNWQEVCESPYLRDLPFKIELNRYGQIVMSPAKNKHAIFQGRIIRKLNILLKNQGEVYPKCPIKTKDNVKVADVAWLSTARYEQVKNDDVCSIAPEICIEVISTSNTNAEMMEKKTLYFTAGAQEVWLCEENGMMHFYTPASETAQSLLIPEFPKYIET